MIWLKLAIFLAFCLGMLILIVENLNRGGKR